jgi:hypothetical protein
MTTNNSLRPSSTLTFTCTYLYNNNNKISFDINRDRLDVFKAVTAGSLSPLHGHSDDGEDGNNNNINNTGNNNHDEHGTAAAE